MRVLVTGCDGYIGSVMVPALKREGHQVVGLDTFYYEDCGFSSDTTVIPRIRKDVRDIRIDDVEGFNAIVHLAALCNDPLGDLNPGWTEDINYQASIRLARLAKEAGVERFLYASSCAMYGASSRDEVLTEEAPLNPLSAYAISKAKSEEDISKLAGSSFSPVFMRCATAYGMSPRLRADVVLNNLVCWAATTGKVRIMSDGTPWRPIVHIEDIAGAFAAVLAAPEGTIHNEAFNVGINGENYQVRDLAEIITKVVPNCEIEYSNQSGPDPRDYRVDFSKIAKALPGFQPRWNAELGARQLYSAYLQQGLTSDDFQGRKFTRLKQLRHLLDTGRLDNAIRWRVAEAVL